MWPSWIDTLWALKVLALIRVAKGRTKSGEESLRESRRGPAIGVAFEILGYADQAAQHLQTVLEALQRNSLSDITRQSG